MIYFKLLISSFVRVQKRRWLLRLGTHGTSTCKGVLKIPHQKLKFHHPILCNMGDPVYGSGFDGFKNGTSPFFGGPVYEEMYVLSFFLHLSLITFVCTTTTCAQTTSIRNSNEAEYTLATTPVGNSVVLQWYKINHVIWMSCVWAFWYTYTLFSQSSI